MTTSMQHTYDIPGRTICAMYGDASRNIGHILDGLQLKLDRLLSSC